MNDWSHSSAPSVLFLAIDYESEARDPRFCRLDDRSLFRRDFYFRAGRQISIGQAGQSLIEPIDSLRSGASGATIIHRGSLGRAIILFRSPVSSSIIFRAFHLPPSVCAHKPNQFHDFSGIKDLSYVFDDVDFKN